MRRFAIFTAGAALVLGSLAIPGMAAATGRASSPANPTVSAAQNDQLDNEITALGKKGHKGKSHHKGYRHGSSRHRHGYYRHGWRGGSCYGCWGPGTRCDRWGCAVAVPYYGYGYGYGYAGYYGAPWWGGFGCNFDYPCGPPYDEQCRSFRGAPSPDPRCQAQTAPAPGANGQPAPAPDQNAAPAPAPDQGAAPAPDQGMAQEPQPVNDEPLPY